MTRTSDRLAGDLTTEQALAGAVTRQAQDPAALPVAAAPADASPRGAAGLPSPAADSRSRAGEGTKTLHPAGSPTPLPGGAPMSPRRERAAQGMPGPETGARPPLLGQAPVRARTQTPARAAIPREDAAPAGSTGTLFVNVQDTERTALECARRADSKAFLDAHLAGKMTEAELEEQIRDACTTLGILRFHVRFSMGTTAGLPDDILIGPRGILWRECKTAKGKVTAAQQEAGTALTNAGQDWAVWRPADWFSGRIQRELAGLAGIRGTAS